MPLVSVVIPCYNQGRYLRYAVESALGQTHGEVEVVIVNDGSSDDTHEVATRYAGNPRVRYVRQENRGLCPARVSGVAASAGEYINFLDSDDILAPDKIEKQLRVIESDPRLAFVYCDIRYIDEAGAEVPEKNSGSIAGSRNQLSGDIFTSLFAGGYFPPHTPLVRRSAYEAVGGFDPALGGCGDWDLWLRLAARGFHAYYLDEKLALYRVHPAGMSRDTSGMQEDEVRVIAKLVREFPQRAAEGYFSLRRRTEDLFVANSWLNGHRLTLEAEHARLGEEHARLKKHVAALDGCPKFVRYPIYGFMLLLRKACLGFRARLGR